MLSPETYYCNDICMVSLKQSSRSVLQKKFSWKFPKINRKTPPLKYLFKNFASLRPATLLKRCFLN